MNKPLRLLAALGCAIAAVGAASVAQADKPGHHDSNTLHKIGKAIEYPVRKAGENASINAHRLTGRKSVVHRRNGNRTYRAVITPNGRVHRLHSLQAENRMKARGHHYAYGHRHHYAYGHRHHRK